MQCHLETTSFPLPNAIRRFDRAPFSYRPDEPLARFVMFFDHAPGTGHDEKFEIVNSAYRFRKSRCFLESKAGALVCTSCHDPHDVLHGRAAADQADGVCRTCHTASSGPHMRDGDCVACHMPKRRTEDVVHAVMTDHRIQRPTLKNPLGELGGGMASTRLTGAKWFPILTQSRFIRRLRSWWRRAMLRRVFRGSRK